MELQELIAHRTVEDTRQSVWTVRRTYKLRAHKLRATVHNDPYRFQCDFYLELFNPHDLQWNRVHTEPNEWHEQFNALSTERLNSEQWVAIDMLIARMLGVGYDLLEGVDA